MLSDILLNLHDHLLNDVKLGLQLVSLVLNLQLFLLKSVFFLGLLTSHLLILSLEQVNVSVHVPFVVVDRANSGFLLVLVHLLLQDFEFKPHEVNLLLQVENVVIVLVSVSVSLIHVVTQSCVTLLVLPSEVDWHR